jgi:hypothetical protein
MATLLLNVCPVEINLCISRGDTTPWTFTILKADGVTPENITGFSYLLTVDPSDEPADAVDNLFSLTGTVTDGPNGVVQFELSVAQADNFGEFFFDLQQTDGASKIRTIVKGAWEFKQDITK